MQRQHMWKSFSSQSGSMCTLGRRVVWATRSDRTAIYQWIFNGMKMFKYEDRIGPFLSSLDIYTLSLYPNNKVNRHSPYNPVLAAIPSRNPVPLLIKAVDC